MKVCLIVPPRLLILFSTSARPGAPIGMAYIAGAIKNAGHTLTVIDALTEGYDKYTKFHGDIVMNGFSFEEIGNRVPADTEVIGISCMFSCNWVAARDLINYLGERFPHARIVIGGEHVSAAPEYCLQSAKHLDVCAIGEGEETIVDIINAYENKRDLSEVPGILYRNAAGDIITTKKRLRVKNLDDIALPAWEYFPVSAYSTNEMTYSATNTKSIPILATRGCPYSCTFCSSPQMWGTKYSMRSVEKVVDEMEFLHTTYGITDFEFYDLTAIIKKDWIIQFATEIVERKLGITWQTPAGTRSEVINDEVAWHLKASGCAHMVYAPESGSPEILHLIKKKVKLSNMIDSIRASKRQGLGVKLNIIIGFPEEKHKHIWQTIFFLIQCSWYGTDDAMPSIYNPYPGSEMFDKLYKEGRVKLEDDYFLQIPLANSFTDSISYSNYISPFVIKFYFILLLVVFYGTSYLFRPVRIVRTIRNLIRSNYTTRGEMHLGEFLKRNFKSRAAEKNPPVSTGA